MSYSTARRAFFGPRSMPVPRVGSGLGEKEDHDFSKNIIHLVLARVKGAPKGVKGISLFIVPKF
jgi:hypothetical protein